MCVEVMVGETNDKVSEVTVSGTSLKNLRMDLCSFHHHFAYCYQCGDSYLAYTGSHFSNSVIKSMVVKLGDFMFF